MQTHQLPESSRCAVSVGALSVDCHVAGRDEADSTPIVLLPGTGGTTATHFGFLFPMIGTRHRVVSVDLTCDPVVAADDPLTLEQLEAQVLAATDATLPGRRVTLVGYSLGAVVAAFVAARHPDRIANLVLIAGWVRTDAQQQMRNGVWRDLRTLGAASLLDYMVYCAFSARFLSARSAGEIAAMRDAITLTPQLNRMMDLNRRIDLADLVGLIEARTLVIGCRHDAMVPVYHAKALFGAIPDARYSEIASGHAVVFERPAELLRLIDAFAADPTRVPAGGIIPEARP